MELNNSERVRLLVKHLLLHPGDAARYFWHNLIVRRMPLELSLPWWSYSAIHALDAFLWKGARVFEYGSGGSTLYLLKQGARITVIEDDESWYKEIVSRIPERLHGAIDMRLVACDWSDAGGFSGSDYLNALTPGEFDLVIVDGPDPDFGKRPLCFHHAETCIREGGLIVLDDFWRYRSLLGSHRARSVKVCEGVGPGRFGVTSTALFYY